MDETNGGEKKKKEGAPILGLLFICSKRQRKGLVTKQTMPVFRGIV